MIRRRRMNGDTGNSLDMERPEPRGMGCGRPEGLGDERPAADAHSHKVVNFLSYSCQNCKFQNAYLACPNRRQAMRVMVMLCDLRVVRIVPLAIAR